MKMKLPCESGDDLLKIRCLEFSVRFDPAMKIDAKTRRFGSVLHFKWLFSDCLAKTCFYEKCTTLEPFA